LRKMKKKTNDEYRITMVFSLKNKVGALLDALRPFKKDNINLTRIISRPHELKESQYTFFIEIEGSKNDPRVREALKELKKHTTSLYILGSYPLKKVR